MRTWVDLNTKILTDMDIELPRYKGAPITGENLKLMMKAYYPEYKDGPDKSYTTTAQKMQLLAAENTIYRLYSMDDVEALFLRHKQLISSLTLPITKYSWTRSGLLVAILHNAIKGFYYNADDNPGFKVFISNLGKLMNA